MMARKEINLWGVSFLHVHTEYLSDKEYDDEDEVEEEGNEEGDEGEEPAA
jgi:hypothetical protein